MKPLSRLATAAALALATVTGANANTLDLTKYTQATGDTNFNFCSNDNYHVQAKVLAVTPKNQPVSPATVNAYFTGLWKTLNDQISKQDKKDVGYPQDSFTFLRVQMGTYSQVFNVQNKTDLQPVFTRFYIGEKPSAECAQLKAAQPKP